MRPHFIESGRSFVEIGALEVELSGVSGKVVCLYYQC